MKKSQILAALALAMSLGVVAPVASTYAYVMSDGGTGKADVEKDIDDAMTAANKLGNCTEGSENMLGSYNGLINAVNNGAKSIEAAKVSAYNALKASMSGPTFVGQMQAAGAAADNSAWKNYGGTTVNAYTNYDGLLAYAKSLLNDLQAAFEGHPERTDVETAAEALSSSTDTSGLIQVAETTVQKADNGARGAINTILGASPFSQVITGNTSYDLAAAAAKATPKYSNFEVLLKQYFVVSNIKDNTDEGFRVSTAQAQVDILNEDIANFCSTTLTGTEAPKPDTTEPEEEDKKDEAGKGEQTPDKGGIGAGNEGVLSTAEGTAAASAGIMAAVATALTAAGVGVVAFRNARRASKKA